MIIVKATMYPANGSPSYEVLHSQIENIGYMAGGDQYHAHVTQRPFAPHGQLVNGFEADVEVRGHRYESGFAPLFTAILGQAAVDVGYGTKGRLVLPECITRQRVVLTDVQSFMQASRRYT